MPGDLAAELSDAMDIARAQSRLLEVSTTTSARLQTELEQVRAQRDALRDAAEYVDNWARLIERRNPHIDWPWLFRLRAAIAAAKEGTA